MDRDEVRCGGKGVRFYAEGDETEYKRFRGEESSDLIFTVDKSFKLLCGEGTKVGMRGGCELLGRLSWYSGLMAVTWARVRQWAGEQQLYSNMFCMYLQDILTNA